ncbi:MAG: twin-arginine translocase subunit TatC [Candidatus Nealsonbacteria bacterium]|nr:twin-arginine translocase subunit TatC [Candidatus Nealsonbacteria bacterium]
MFFTELRQFAKVISSWFYLFLIFSGFFFVFGLKEVGLFGQTFLLPLPTINSFSVQIFKIIERTLVPSNVQLIATEPFAAFLVQIKISLLLAFVFTLPVFLYRILFFLSPALYQNEKKAIFKLLIPSTFLFVSGCFFAYFLLIPLTFQALYSFVEIMDITPFFSLDKFIGLTLGLMFVTGLMFLLPVLIALLSYFGLIEPDFWKNNWRYAILFFLIVSAIITPDGTGITMMILSAPLSLLYFGGMIVANKNRRKYKRNYANTMRNNAKN